MVDKECSEDPAPPTSRRPEAIRTHMQAPTTAARDDLDRCLAALSALCDGQAGKADQEMAFRAWHGDPRVKQAWQDWHLIADVMRTEDLSPGQGRDDAFLIRLRAQIALEPSLVAPTAPSVEGLDDRAPGRGRTSGRRGMVSAVAVAAGFLAVMVTLWVVQDDTDASAGSFRAVLSDVARTVGWSVPEEPAWQAVDGRLIRDAQLDSYLRAHRAGAPALPGGVTGRFETVVLEP
jgi:sigma-E factor negative regulatory protein RseA